MPINHPDLFLEGHIIGRFYNRFMCQWNLPQIASSEDYIHVI